MWSGYFSISAPGHLQLKTSFIITSYSNIASKANHCFISRPLRHCHSKTTTKHNLCVILETRTARQAQTDLPAPPGRSLELTSCPCARSTGRRRRRSWPCRPWSGSRGWRRWCARCCQGWWFPRCGTRTAPGPPFLSRCRTRTLGYRRCFWLCAGWWWLLAVLEVWVKIRERGKGSRAY